MAQPYLEISHLCVKETHTTRVHRDPRPQSVTEGNAFSNLENDWKGSARVEQDTDSSKLGGFAEFTARP